MSTFTRTRPFPGGSAGTDQHPVAAPKNDVGEPIEPLPYFHDWDPTPHGMFVVGLNAIALGDMVLGGTHQIGGIGQANQRGQDAIRLDLFYVAAPSIEESARLVLPLDHLLEIKRYFPNPGHGYAWVKLIEGDYPASLVPDYGERTEFCCKIRGKETVNPHGYDLSAVMCDDCAIDWDDFNVVRWGPRPTYRV